MFKPNDNDATSITVQSSNDGGAMPNILSSDKTDTTVLPNSNNNIKVDEESISICEPEERMNHLSNVCNKYHHDNFPRRYKFKFIYSLYVNDKYKYLACLPQKAGSSTWKMILMNNTLNQSLPADFHGIHRQIKKGKHSIRQLYQYSKQQQNRIINEYYKFMVVRHPLDRLVSSYNHIINMANGPEHRDRMIDLNVKNHGNSEPDLRVFFEYIIEQNT